MKTKEEILTRSFGCEHLSELKKCFITDDMSLVMITDAMEEYANQKQTYIGEEGRENMKNDIKEIMHAVGDKFDFLNLINEAKQEIEEAQFELDQESRMNGV